MLLGMYWVIINKMDSVEMVPAEREAAQANVRTSRRLRRKPAFFTPGNYLEASAEDDVKYRAVVTDVKGFRDYAENVDFKGPSVWRLKQILRKLVRGLKVDPKLKYQWAIWNEASQSKHHTEWERLTSITQLRNHETAKLRIFKQKKPPALPKKPENKEASKRTVAVSPKPAPRPSLTAQQPYPQFYPQYPPIMTEQEMMHAYMMMFCANPWFYYKNYQ